jgi:LuxR family maltose regulon positive regulatory protein
VKRKRLLESLDRGRSQKLTLVSGPAGSGKSTLLSQWLEESGLPSVWLSLDEADNDRKRFLSYLVGALRRIAPHVGAGGDALLDTADELVLGAALEHLVLLPLSDQPVDFVLVLDDLHVISDREIHQSLDLLLQHMPRGMHLALASRSEPPLSLARLRVQGEVNDVNAEDLRFRSDEALSLYNQTMGLALDSAQVEQLEAKTEGWAAACQLIALRLRDGSGFDAAAEHFSSDARSIDYLVEELLDRQSEPVRDFLEGISILDRACDSLAAAVLDRSEPRIKLAELERQNLLLIPLDDEGHWYRLHPLFSTALRRLLTERAPGREATLHRRASSWLSNQGLIDEAIEHAMASGDQELLAKLVQSIYVTLAKQHDVQTVARCLGALDRNVIDDDPMLLLAEAWYARVMGDYATVEDCSVRLAEAMERLRWPAEVRNLAQPVMDAYRAAGLRMGGEPAASIELATRALQVGPPSSPPLLATYRLQVAALQFELGMTHLEMGNGDEGLAALESAQHLAEDADLLSVLFGSAAARVEALRVRGELGHAESVCEHVLELAEKKHSNLLGMVGVLRHGLGSSTGCAATSNRLSSKWSAGASSPN